MDFTNNYYRMKQAKPFYKNQIIKRNVIYKKLNNSNNNDFYFFNILVNIS